MTKYNLLFLLILQLWNSIDSVLTILHQFGKQEGKATQTNLPFTLAQGFIEDTGSRSYGRYRDA